MTYLISQMWLCLIITAVIAGLIGWLLRGSGKKKLQALDKQWQEQYRSVENARQRYASRIEELSKVEKNNKELSLQVSLQKQSFEQTLQQLKKQTDITNNQQVERLNQKYEEMVSHLTQYDKQLNALEEEKANAELQFEQVIQDEKIQSSLHLSQLQTESEKQLKNYEEQAAALATQLHIKKSDLISAEEELFNTRKELETEKLQTSRLVEGFIAKEKELMGQLTEKDNLLSDAVQAQKNDTSDINNKLNSSNISSKIKSGANKAKESITSQTSTNSDEPSSQTEKSFFTKMKNKFDDFNNADSINNETTTEASTPDDKHSTQKPKHENKISKDIKSMFAATGITALAKKGMDKTRSSFDKTKNAIDDRKDSDQ